MEHAKSADFIFFYNFACLKHYTHLAMTDITTLYEHYLQHPEITTDTRRLMPGAIFFALRGANFNGNDFALQALEAGCAYAVVDDERLSGDARLLHVPDVLVALQQLAALHRRRLATPVLQITGTNGKTTTKELVATVLSEKFNVLYTQGNLNNHIGVPCTLLRLRSEHEMAVIETGANHPGEIAQLSAMVDADCGLITNVGMAHLEGFGSLEGVVRAKSELYDYLRDKPRAFVFLHADNDMLTERAKGLTCVTYGTCGKDAQVEGALISCQPNLVFRWRRQGEAWQEVATHLIGAYNLPNVLAAVAVGLHFGVAVEKISHAISHYYPTNNRSQFSRTAKNQLVIDAYNANPTSMAAALENFRLMEHSHKMLIVGEMRELGEASADAHRQLVEQISAVGAQEVWLVGESFKACGNKYRCFAHVDEVQQELREHPVEGRLILIKGSNGTQLFRLPEFL